MKVTFHDADGVSLETYSVDAVPRQGDEVLYNRRPCRVQHVRWTVRDVDVIASVFLNKTIDALSS